MKITRNLLLLAIAAFVFASCQKELSEETGGEPVLPPEDSTVLLKKYIRLDTTLAAPNDTIFTATYSYDNAKRCTAILYKYFDHPNAMYEGIVEEKIFYNGADTNMLYRTMINTHSMGSDTTKEYFTYDANGIVIKDSVVHDGNDASFYYRYVGNVAHTVSYFANDPTDSVFYTIHYLQKTNGNIVAEKDTTYDATSWPYSTHAMALTDAQFDNHPNPLYKVSPPWPVLFETEHVLQQDFSSQQKNNWLSSYGEFDAWTDPEEYTYQYIYLPNGYPATAKIHYVTEDVYWKAIYQY